MKNNKAEGNHGKVTFSFRRRLQDTERGRRLLDWPEGNVIRQLSL